MYRNVRLFHDSGTMLALFPLIICVAAVTLLSNVEGAQTSFSQREFAEAQKIVGRFLREGAGTTWLSGLIKTSSTPLTTLDLMTAVTQSTRRGGEVWRAATLLSDALKAQNSDGTRPNFATGQNDNWKDLIANIEMEDDIICLYRKNSNETTKKADDWKTFMRNVSPGYMLHLAIDTGRKYVICLKKIDVPETTIDENLTTSATTAVSSVITNEAVTEMTSLLPIREDTTSMPSASNYMRNLNNVETASGQSDDDKNCNNKEVVSTKKPKDIGYYDDYDNEDENIYDDDDYDPDDDNIDYDYPMDNRRRMKKNRRLMENDYPESYVPGRINKNADPRNEGDNNCKRPIIYVLPNGNVVSPYQPPLPVDFSINRIVGSNLPWNTRFSPRMPVKAYDSFSRLPNNSPRPMDVRNLRKPTFNWIPYHERSQQPFISRDKYFRPKFSNEEMRNDNNFARPTLLPIQIRTRPRSQLPSLKSIRADKLQGRPNFIGKTPMNYHNPNYDRGLSIYNGKPPMNYPNVNYDRGLSIDTENPRYPSFNTQPRRIEKTSSERNIRNNQRNVRGPAGYDQWTSPARNIAFPRTRNPNDINQIPYNPFSRLTRPININNDPRMIYNPASLQMPPREPMNFKSQTTKSSQRPRLQPIQHLFYDESRPSNIPTGYQNFRARATQSSMKNFDRTNPRLFDILRSSQRATTRFPCTNFNPAMNYPMRNNIIKQPYVIVPTALPTFNAHCKNPLNQFHPLCAVDSLGNSLGRLNEPTNGVPCRRSCDRPIKLQIVINGEVREPLSVSVISDSADKFEIIGKIDPVMPYGSRSLNNEPALRNGLLHDKEENIQTGLDNQTGQRDENVSSSNGDTSVKTDDDSEGVKKTTTRNEIETMSVRSNIDSNEDPGIKERFFHDTTSESNFSVETNETISTTMNSTIIV